MFPVWTHSHRRHGRSPHGERGLKLTVCSGQRRDVGRSPHGERGLK